MAFNMISHKGDGWQILYAGSLYYTHWADKNIEKHLSLA